VGTNHKYTVLMADDDDEDCLLATEAFLEGGVKAGFVCLGDGMRLIEYLYERCQPNKDQLPDLILLDLNMPRKYGRDALLEIKSHPALQKIPVVILTTSEAEKDIEFSKKGGAELFITKPESFTAWIEILRSLERQWLTG
jgi:CheY-like chemotaxis protein